MKIIIDTLAVGYDKLGESKRVVLLLHGWGTNRKSMSTIAKVLSRDYTVYNIDIPGFGESERPHQAWGLPEYADWLQSFIAKLYISPYALIGHSNGGAIAIKTASLGMPLQKLILLGASGVRTREKGKKLFLKTVTKTGKAATVLLPKKVKTKVRGRWYKSIGSELYDNPGMEEFFKKVTSEDLVIDSAMISVPTLLVYGSEDKATPPAYGRIYHESIEGSELAIVEGAGHYSFFDRPEQTMQLIKKYLSK